MTALVVAAVFAALGYAGIVIGRYMADGVEPLEGAPAPAVPPVAALVVAAGCVGALAASRGVPVPALGLIGIATMVLVAIWCVDVLRGIIPDVLTLVPLCALVGAALLAGHPEALVAAAIPALPFALLAWRSRGHGLGWGDVKLAALGGPLVGLQSAIIAFALASAAAVIVARVRGGSSQPIAFGPYLVAAIAIPLAVLTPA